MIREAFPDDAPRILDLYRRASRQTGGLARLDWEFKLDDVQSMLVRAKTRGLSLVHLIEGQLVGEIHALRPYPTCFSHVLSDLMMAVDPEVQGQGIGGRLFASFLTIARTRWPQVRRVELFTRESNERAIRLYNRMGFQVEGVLRSRIRAADGELESDLLMAYHYDDAIHESDSVQAVCP